MKVRDAIKLLKCDGWEIKEMRGNHSQVFHAINLAKSPCLVIPPM